MFSSNQGAKMGSGSKALLAYNCPVQRLVTHIGIIVSLTLGFIHATITRLFCQGIKL